MLYFAGFNLFPSLTKTSKDSTIAFCKGNKLEVIASWGCTEEDFRRHSVPSAFSVCSTWPMTSYPTPVRQQGSYIKIQTVLISKP